MATSGLAPVRKHAFLGWANAERRSAMILAAAMCLLSACASSNGAVDSGDPGSGEAIGARGGIPGAGGKGKPSPAPVSDPVSVSSNATYDASIGLGVDASGFADLSLRPGAHRYFVSSATGSDSNSCAAAQSPATPKASSAEALACAADGEGDQILFAEGTTYASRMPSMAFRRGGYSLTYPFVIQSYDPADPLNEAKYGRATGTKRPVFRAENPGGNPWIFGGTGQKFIAVRGLDINPGNVSGQTIGMVYVGDGILFENNLLRYTGLAFVNTSGVKQHHWIVRGNAIYGTWDATTATAGQGIYADGSDSLTIEDNVLYHIGWKIGANRTDTLANGGATQFRHPIYQQVPTDAVVRRNLIVDGAADGGSFRGNISHTENVIIDCPIGAALGGGVDYNTGRPNGVDIQSSYNAIIGTATIPDSGANAWGMVTSNGRAGSSAHHNLFLQSITLGGAAFITNADYDQPSYMDWHDNVTLVWSLSGYTHRELARFPAQVRVTFANNKWDDPTSGTNTTSGWGAFPNPYTAAQLYAALGFSSKEAFMADAIAQPEAHPARRARALLFAGYGLN
jgi:hypothetical protein